MREITRDLRKRQTESEKKFWSIVRNRRLGVKFIRQFALSVLYEGQKRIFVADFYCSEKRLIVEIDGGIHEKQKEYDDIRTDIINQQGIKVIRFRNEEVNDTEKIENTLKSILNSI